MLVPRMRPVMSRCSGAPVPSATETCVIASPPGGGREAGAPVTTRTAANHARKKGISNTSLWVDVVRFDAECIHVYTSFMRTSTRGGQPLLELKGTADQIADRVRREIEEGQLAPGAALNQVGLAARFGLSRIRVREALRQLAAEGYVTYRPNKGASVV